MHAKPTVAILRSQADGTTALCQARPPQRLHLDVCMSRRRRRRRCSTQSCSYWRHRVIYAACSLSACIIRTFGRGALGDAQDNRRRWHCLRAGEPRVAAIAIRHVKRAGHKPNTKTTWSGLVSGQGSRVKIRLAHHTSHSHFFLHPRSSAESWFCRSWISVQSQDPIASYPNGSPPCWRDMLRACICLLAGSAWKKCEDDEIETWIRYN